MKKKELYEAPSVETYELVTEGSMMNQGSPTFSNQGTEKLDYDPEDDLL